MAKYGTQSVESGCLHGALPGCLGGRELTTRSTACESDLPHRTRDSDSAPIKQQPGQRDSIPLTPLDAWGTKNERMGDTGRLSCITQAHQTPGSGSRIPSRSNSARGTLPEADELSLLPIVEFDQVTMSSLASFCRQLLPASAVAYALAHRLANVVRAAATRSEASAAGSRKK